MRFPPKAVVAKEAWPVRVPYALCPFTELNQLADGDFVDLIGRIGEVGQLMSESSLPKRKVHMQNDECRDPQACTVRTQSSFLM